MLTQAIAKHRDSIRELLDLAFQPSRYESCLREVIVEKGLPCLEWIVVRDERVAAYIMYTPATKQDEVVGYHLAPVAVHPDFQGQGIGAALIRETLSMEPLSSTAVFVLGDPNYYEKFGFVETSSAQCPYDEANAHFRALRWAERDAPFTIGYSPAFELAEKLL